MVCPFPGVYLGFISGKSTLYPLLTQTYISLEHPNLSRLCYDGESYHGIFSKSTIWKTKNLVLLPIRPTSTVPTKINAWSEIRKWRVLLNGSWRSRAHTEQALVPLRGMDPLQRKDGGVQHSAEGAKSLIHLYRQLDEHPGALWPHLRSVHLHV